MQDATTDPGALPDSTGFRRGLRSWSAVHACALLAALCHLSWLSAAYSPSKLDARTSYVSELLALGQPWSPFLRSLDTLAGLAVLYGVGVAWGLTSPARSGTRARTHALILATHLGLGVFGLATIVDAWSPLSCAPSASAACAAAEASGRLPAHHSLHTVSSSIATLGAVIGFAALAILVARARSLSRPAARRAYIAAVLAFAATTVWVLVEIAGATLGSPLAGQVGIGALGWSQRAQVTLSSVCLILIAWLRPLSSSGATQLRRFPEAGS